MKRLAGFPAVTHRLFQGSLETKLHSTLWSKSLQISIRLFLGAMECLAWWHRCFSLLKHTYMKETKYVSDFNPYETYIREVAGNAFSSQTSVLTISNTHTHT